MERCKQNRENYENTSLTGRRKSAGRVAPESPLSRRKIKEPILMVNIIPDIIADPRNEIAEYNCEILDEQKLIINCSHRSYFISC